VVAILPPEHTSLRSGFGTPCPRHLDTCYECQFVRARGLLLAADYEPARGGIARLLEAWTANTEEMEWRIVTTTPGPASQRVIRTNHRSILAAAAAQSRWLRRSKDRAVVAGHPYYSGLAVAAAAFTRSRSGCSAFGLELVAHQTRHRLALAPLRAVSSVIAISDHTAKLATRAGARNCVRVVRPCLRSPWLATVAPMRRRGDPLRLVAVSRLAEGYKNLELLLRLCAVLHPAKIIDRMTIIGDGGRLAALRAKADSLGIGNVVDLPGHLPDDEVAMTLSECHVGLFPSRNSIAEGGFEGFGLVVHELAAAGLPVLVADAAGAIDAADEPWTCLLDPDDLWAWVEAVRELYDDETRRSELGNAALAWGQSVDPLESAREFSAALFAAG
jgi:glycosyltransferase involved in cell wall biosynthesis